MVPPPARKRAAGVAISVSSSRPSKKSRPEDSSIPQNQAQIKQEAAAASQPQQQQPDAGVKERFLRVFENDAYKNGISNSVLKELFGETEYLALAPVINELVGLSRLTMSKVGSVGGTSELFYQLVSSELAEQFRGLDVSAKMVYQLIERAGNMGIWTKDIRIQSSIQQTALNKIFKTLESRQLIKPVKSVAAKSKKLYMLYSLSPAKELTGGVWYSDLEFDHEFISEMRSFILQCVKRMNGGKGVTLKEILEKTLQARISKEELTTVEISQLVHTLIYDYMVEEAGPSSSADHNGDSAMLYVAARKVTPMCDFTWWDALEPDFHFRKIRFEDGVELSAHEPHYHTA